MACGPITLTPQIVSTAMTFFGQPAALPPDLSMVMNPTRTQAEMKVEVLCDDTGKASGFTLERYFDTMTRTVTVVPLDDGEVDEQVSSFHSANDGRVAQKLTVFLDTENKLAQYKVEALCSGTNPNAPVCMTHVPTVTGFALPNHKGQHADWMQAFVPEVISGGEYLFVTSVDYPQVKKEAEEKRKVVPAPVPVPVPTAMPIAPPTSPATASPSAPLPATAPKAESEGGVLGGLSLIDLLAVAAGVLGIGSVLLSRFARRTEKPAAKVHPEAKAVVQRQLQEPEDPGIQRPSEKTRPAKKKVEKAPVVEVDADFDADIEKALKEAKEAQAEPNEEDRPTQDGTTS